MACSNYFFSDLNKVAADKNGSDDRKSFAINQFGNDCEKALP